MSMNSFPNSPGALHDQDWEITKPESVMAGKVLPHYKWVLTHLGELCPNTVLDVGCGAGYLGGEIKQIRPNCTVHGFDISNVAVERAKMRLDKVWQHDISLNPIPVAASYYDAVLCCEVLEHLYEPNYCLCEIRRVLKNGGHGYITVPNIAYIKHRFSLLRGKLPRIADDPRHLHQYTKETLLRSVMAAGLKPVTCYGYRYRFTWLAKASPSVFCEYLFLEVVQTP